MHNNGLQQNSRYMVHFKTVQRRLPIGAKEKKIHKSTRVETLLFYICRSTACTVHDVPMLRSVELYNCGTSQAASKRLLVLPNAPPGQLHSFFSCCKSELNRRYPSLIWQSTREHKRLLHTVVEISESRQPRVKPRAASEGEVNLFHRLVYTIF